MTWVQDTVPSGTNQQAPASPSQPGEAAQSSGSLALEALDDAPSLMGLVELTEVGDILHIWDNIAACEFFGLVPGGTAGRLATELGASERTVAEWRTRYESSAATRRAVRFEHGYPGPNGEETLLVSVRPVTQGPSGRQRFLYVAENITARKRAEQAAHHAEARATNILESVSDAFFALDHQWRFTYANAEAQRLLAHERDQLLGQNVWELFPSLAGTEFERAYRRATEQNIAATVTAYYPDHDRIYEARVYPNPRGLAVYFRNVTESVRTQQERERLLAELTASEERYRATFHAAPVGVAHVGLDGSWQRFNEAVCVLTGYARDELQRMTFADITHPDDLERDWAATRGLLAGEGTSFTMDKRYVRKDGSSFWVSLSVSLLRGADGAPLHYIAVLQDIDARKRVEAELLAVRTELDAIVSGMSEGINIAGLDGSVLRMNEASTKLLGYSDEASFRRKLPDFEREWELHYPSGKLMPVEEWPLSRVLRGEELTGYVVHVRRRYIDLARTLSYNGRIVRHQGGEPLALVSFRDVTELTRIEAELRSREHELQTLADNTPDILSRFNRRLQHVFVNAAAERVMGIARQAHIGKTCRDLGMPDVLCLLWEEQLRRVFDAGLEHRFEFSLQGAGGVRHYDARLIPEFGPDDVVEHVLGIAQDVTEAKQAEDALRAADRRKDEFLATLAHELRNPLAPIRNAVHILKSRGARDPKLVWCHDVIDRQVHHMTRLLEDLLDVSRISRGKMELRTERLELASVIDAAVETSRPAIDAGRHELRIDLPAGPIAIDGDPVRLAQVFSNLLNNAAKYTPNGGTILLTVVHTGTSVTVSITDNGIGIPSEVLPTVFDIFSQAASAMSRAQGGLGVGLSLVRGLVQLHGGSVSAHSEGPGRGSEFVVRLPTPPPVAEAASRQELVHGAITGQRVLVVDDNTDSADTLSALLEIMGCEVRTAYDGQQALAIAERYLPTVMLLDIGMPGLNGFVVCERLRAQPWGRSILLIAMTGWGQAEDRRQTRETGFDHHLVKPVDTTALMKLLADHAPTARAAPR